MLGFVISLRLGHVALGVLHKVSLGLLAAEAVGLAANGRVDRTVRIDVLPRESPSVHMLLNSPVTARAAVVPRPSNRAPAKADVM